MITNRNRVLRLGWLLIGAAALTLFVAACSDDTADPTTDPITGTETGGTLTPDDSMTPSETPSDTPTDEPTDEPTDDGTGMELSGTVDDVAGVGVTGMVTVVETAGETEVALELSALPEGTYTASLAQGTCDAPGEMVTELGEINADATGDVNETYMVAESIDTMAEGHSLIVEDDAAEVVACAVLE